MRSCCHGSGIGVNPNYSCWWDVALLTFDVDCIHGCFCAFSVWELQLHCHVCITFADCWHEELLLFCLHFEFNLLYLPSIFSVNVLLLARRLAMAWVANGRSASRAWLMCLLSPDEHRHRAWRAKCPEVQHEVSLMLEHTTCSSKTSVQDALQVCCTAAFASLLSDNRLAGAFQCRAVNSAWQHQTALKHGDMPALKSRMHGGSILLRLAFVERCLCVQTLYWRMRLLHGLEYV